VDILDIGLCWIQVLSESDSFLQICNPTDFHIHFRRICDCVTNSNLTDLKYKIQILLQNTASWSLVISHPTETGG